jgi:hypothetical protein
MEGILYLTNEVGIALSKARQESQNYQAIVMTQSERIASLEEELVACQQRNRDLMEAQGE